MAENNHKAGFVNILGKPNVGKSTLMNALVGERLSIITSKAQTTRHRIMGIINSENFQIVYSDTPGIIKPAYELQKSMMRFISNSIEDADIILFLVDISKNIPTPDQHPDFFGILKKIKEAGTPYFILLNKIDLLNKPEILEKVEGWRNAVTANEIIPVSALNSKNLDTLFDLIVRYLPVHPPYFPKDEITDKPERFFAAEIIREKIFLNYQKEIPYSTEVAITEFKEEEDIIRMRAEIFVERKSQRGIIIGKGGESIKQVGIQARKDLEAFFDKQVYLEQFVKVEPDWRKKSSKLNKFGYK